MIVHLNKDYFYRRFTDFLIDESAVSFARKSNSHIRFSRRSKNLKMTLKEKTLQYYKQLVQDKIDVFQDMISNLTEDAKNDAKGSAGDKHETALSMMHLEQEKLNHKIKEFIEHKNILDKIDASKITKVITVGSLIKANGILLFMSAALPKIKIEEKNIIALSPQSPLGSKLIGQQVNYTFEINGTKYLIESVE